MNALYWYRHGTRRTVEAFVATSGSARKITLVTWSLVTGSLNASASGFSKPNLALRERVGGECKVLDSTSKIARPRAAPTTGSLGINDHESYCARRPVQLLWLLLGPLRRDRGDGSGGRPERLPTIPGEMRFVAQDE